MANGSKTPADKVEDRPSPVQIVVTANAQDAATCHDLKSGYMECRSQTLILSVPPADHTPAPNGKTDSESLMSSDDHDMYVSMNWSTLVIARALFGFLQASADLATAANSPVTLANDPSLPASPFLIPSFVKVAYLSEVSPKLAKWRMHGDFFHPATTEIDGNSFDVAWTSDSLASSSLKTLCRPGGAGVVPRKLTENGHECGQWWMYFVELQMPTSPGVHANEKSPPLVQGGSNSVWMLTERQRQELVKAVQCHRDGGDAECAKAPQATIPLGDMESFLINDMPNSVSRKSARGCQ